MEANRSVFQDLCITHLDYIRHIHLPDIPVPGPGPQRAVLYIDQYYPHIEFVLRNVIIQLGNGWCHSVVCGDMSTYESMHSIALAICPHIAVSVASSDNSITDHYGPFTCIFPDGDRWTDAEEWTPEHTRRFFTQIVIQFRPYHRMDGLEFRGGWKSALQKLEDLHFFSADSPYPFFDILEQHFYDRSTYTCTEKWAGVIHLTPNGPSYLRDESIRELFDHPPFVNSLEHCMVLFTLSTYVTQFIQSELARINRTITIITLKHPVVMDNIVPFSMEKYVANPEKKFLQVGQQYRKVTSIYRVSAPGHTKLWLTGTRNFPKLYRLLKKEAQYLEIDIGRVMIPMLYTDTFEEYDELLSQNVVFVDLFDAAANNTVLECIVRKTPILVNRVGGIAEYLGEDYPLYFSTLDEVPGLLTIDNLTRAHEYLKNICVQDLTMDAFVGGLLSGLRGEW